MRLDPREALRYLGVRGEPPAELAGQVEAVAAELTAALVPRYVYRLFQLEETPAGPALAGTELTLPGATAGRMLAGCQSVVLLACTLGVEFDRRLLAAQVRDMAKAAILDACAGAWVEAGCDQAEAELKARLPGRCLTDRFSPGYGDLPLELQGELCSALDTPKRLGLYVTKSCMLDPVKSVTAVIGVSDVPQPARIRGCGACGMRGSCTFQRGGERCGA